MWRVRSDRTDPTPLEDASIDVVNRQAAGSMQQSRVCATSHHQGSRDQVVGNTVSPALHHQHGSNVELTPSTRAPASCGRKRTVPVMNNSERSRYYRRKNAERKSELELAIRELIHGEMALVVKLQLHQDLLDAIPTRARQRIAEDVSQFVSTREDATASGLEPEACRYEFRDVFAMPCAKTPIVRLRILLHGKLVNHTLTRIYSFLLGNTVILSNMMHQELAFPCSHTFYFSAHGQLERHTVEIDTLVALARPLEGLVTVARVVAHLREAPAPATLPSSSAATHLEDKSEDS